MLKSQQFGRIAWTQAEIDEHERKARPRFTSLAHVSLPVRDLAEARRFYEEVLGGRAILHTPDFVEVVVGGTILGFSVASGKPNAPDAEFPHVAFLIESDQFLPMKEWLEHHGVKTHQPWTRNAVEGLMYFKDPSGNLLEAYCKDFDDAKALSKTPKIGNIVDLQSLNYEWKP
jgi:catechol 2,3-dioxygenase-like lactoylglutathione lyase family enzyme